MSSTPLGQGVEHEGVVGVGAVGDADELAHGEAGGYQIDAICCWRPGATM